MDGALTNMAYSTPEYVNKNEKTCNLWVLDSKSGSQRWQFEWRENEMNDYKEFVGALLGLGGKRMTTKYSTTFMWLSNLFVISTGKFCNIRTSHINIIWIYSALMIQFKLLKFDRNYVNYSFLLTLSQITSSIVDGDGVDYNGYF